jgi:ribosomal protein S18 acetylase RimI-like enzyme
MAHAVRDDGTKRRDRWAAMGDEYVNRTSESVDEPRRVEKMPPQRARRVARGVVVQAQLTVGPAGDRYEQEADRVAAEVMRHLGRQPLEAEAATIEDDAGEPPRVRRANRRVDAQRHVSRIQLRADAPTVGLRGGDVDVDTDAAIRRATGKGEPLGNDLRQSMEHSFSADFSAVRIHADGEADVLNRKVQAKAFTTGRDIFFSKGQYAPSSRSGQELLAHELVHVVQQRAAGVYRRPVPSRRVRRSTIERAPSDDEQPAVSESTSGRGRSKITLSGRKGVIGSVTVDAVDESSVEATNLAVEPSQRGRGYGSELVAAAARSAEGLGRSRVTLGSQDNGSGKLDGWYKSLGFTKTGTASDRTSRFEAPTTALRRTRVQRTAARVTSSGQPSVSRAAELRESPRIRRAEPTWYEKVGDKIEGRVGKKPGGYRLVKGVLSPTGKAVYETAEQRATHVEKPKTYAELVGVLPAADSTAAFSVDAELVRYSQDSIGRTFTSGAPIAELAASLKNGTTKPSALPAIRVLMSKGGRLVTLDNRRLWCCKEAGVKIKCVWATAEEVEKEGYKFTSSQGKDGLTTITVRA